MTLEELNANFGLEGVLGFEEHAGLRRCKVRTAAVEATVYLQGAHLTHWQPASFGPVLFLSERTELAPGKAIRGGIPVCFPWFGPRSAGLGSGAAGRAVEAGGAHGFARNQPWELAFAALSGEDVHLTFFLGPSELSRSLGFDQFHVAYEMILGRTLTLRFSVANLSDEPLRFEEALHTYFAVADVRDTVVTGLESATYIDKTDGQREKQLPGGPLLLSGWTDRIFPGNTAETILGDTGNGRSLRVSKRNSASTVVWNPWAEKSEGMADLAPDAWTRFLCVESANAGADAITLLPHQAHSMEVEISVLPL